jgi:hypothetical protein
MHSLNIGLQEGSPYSGLCILAQRLLTAPIIRAVIITKIVIKFIISY